MHLAPYTFRSDQMRCAFKCEHNKLLEQSSGVHASTRTDQSASLVQNFSVLRDEMRAKRMRSTRWHNEIFARWWYKLDRNLNTEQNIAETGLGIAKRQARLQNCTNLLVCHRQFLSTHNFADMILLAVCMYIFRAFVFNWFESLCKFERWPSAGFQIKWCIWTTYIFTNI